MSRVRNLRLRDVRQVQELLEEIADQGLSPDAWRPHMLRRLCDMTHARVGITTDLQGALPGMLLQSIEPADVGFDDRERQLFAGYLASDDRLVDPGANAMMANHRQSHFFTLRRQEMVETADWYSSPVVSEGRRSVNIDHFLVSSVALEQPGWLTGFALYRNWGDAPFDERDRRIVRLFHVGLLQRLRISRQGHATSAQRLPVYLKQMLRSLLRGHDVKESAEFLGLSSHTVKSYTKQLYSRLEINSRGKLLAKFLNSATGRPIFLPAAFDSAY